MEGKREFPAGDSAPKIDKKHKKKICFVPGAAVLELLDQQHGSPPPGSCGGEDEDDLDLDVLAAAPRSRRVRKDVYSESDQDEYGLLEEEPLGSACQGAEDDALPPPRLSEEEGEEAATGLAQDDDAEQFTPFNMKEEQEEGRFDGEQNYVRAVDAEAHQDNWLAGISKDDMRRAQEAGAKRLAQLARTEAEARQRALPIKDQVARLLRFMVPGESVAQCLQRQSVGLVQRRVGVKAPKLSEAERQRQDEQRRGIEEITELCSSLLAAGVTSIYDESMESLRI